MLSQDAFTVATLEVDKQAVAKVVLRNAGPLTALDVWVWGTSMLGGPAPVFPQGGGPISPPGMSRTEWQERESRTVVGPGASITIPIPFGPYNQGAVDAIKGGTRRLYFYGCANYRDKTRRAWTLKFCGFYEPTDASVNFCHEHNREEEGRTCH